MAQQYHCGEENINRITAPTPRRMGAVDNCSPSHGQTKGNNAFQADLSGVTKCSEPQYTATIMWHCKTSQHKCFRQVWYGILGFNVQLDTV